MNRPDVFRNSLDTLIDAYVNDDLESKQCGSCAVGNLVAAATGNDPQEDPKNWDAQTTAHGDRNWYGLLRKFRGTLGRKANALDIAPSLPYTNREIDRIEAAFEKTGRMARNHGYDYVSDFLEDHPHLEGSDDWLHLRIRSVVHELMDIHGVETGDRRAELLAELEEHEPVTA